ncbi:putative acetyltransferase [compost metagenome]
MPGVTIGKHSIIGAGSVVTKSIPEGCIAVGNPAQVVTTVEAYRMRNKERLKEAKTYDTSYTHKGRISSQQKHQMYEELLDEVGFVL